MLGNQLRRLAPLLLGLGPFWGGCSGSGPTTIEIPITRIQVVRGCPVVVVGQECQLVVAAFSGTRQVADPVLGFLSTSFSAAVDGEGVVRGVSPGFSEIVITDRAGNARTESRVTVIGSTTK